MLRSFLLLMTLLIFSGCSTLLLDMESLNALKISESPETEIVYHKTVYKIDEAGGLRKQAHRIIRMGSRNGRFMEHLITPDGSLLRLLKYEARIIHSSGKSKKYGKNDLLTVSASNRHIINEEFYKILPVAELLEQGDLLETVEVHEQTLAPLGIRFSPATASLPASLIEAVIECPLNCNVVYHVTNDTVTPEITETEEIRRYDFRWRSYKPSSGGTLFTYTNDEPELWAVLPGYKKSDGKRSSLNNWQDFGDWYLDQIRHRIIVTPAIEQTAQDVCKNALTDKEKLDAIFDFCQQNIRYEQVYLEQGGFIPNDPALILSRKYGDCKDYSLIIHILARSVGVETELALCWRGRGREFYEQLPVSQFNHMILHYSEEDSHYWYDGTNRTGLPGITTHDLANQKALILKEGSSVLETIGESANNLLEISGVLRQNDTAFDAELSLIIKNQYAIPFFFFDIYFNRADMTTHIVDWLNNTINPDMRINRLDWIKDKTKFIIRLRAEIPNSLVYIKPNYYTSLSRICSNIMPDSMRKGFDENLFMYYPGSYYNKFEIDLTFPELETVAGPAQGADKSFRLKLGSDLPAGPYEPREKARIYRTFRSKLDTLHNNHKIKPKELS